jgi:hypothetical protein
MLLFTNSPREGHLASVMQAAFEWVSCDDIVLMDDDDDEGCLSFRDLGCYKSWFCHERSFVCLNLPRE